MITEPISNLIPQLLKELDAAKATIAELQARIQQRSAPMTASEMANHARMIVAREIRTQQDGEVSDLIDTLVIQYGGTLVTPSTSNWHGHEFEITLLGCSSRGDTIQAAAKQWAKAASRMATETLQQAA